MFKNQPTTMKAGNRYGATLSIAHRCLGENVAQTLFCKAEADTILISDPQTSNIQRAILSENRNYHYVGFGSISSEFKTLIELTTFGGQLLAQAAE